ncbi:hypothetical protein [Saccharopolyspora tripterygii]
MVLHPTSWVEEGGWTFRWEPGDVHMVVLRGIGLGATWGNRRIVARIPVNPEGWRDDNDLLAHAREWLLQQQANKPQRRC